MPTNRMPTISSEVAIGMPDEGRGDAAIHGQGALARTVGLLPGALAPARASVGCTTRAGLQPVLPGDHDPLARRQALLDDRLCRRRSG